MSSYSTHHSARKSLKLGQSNNCMLRRKIFKCPLCKHDGVMVYSAQSDRSAYVVCGECRALVVFEELPRLHEPIDLYNYFYDKLMQSKGFTHVEQPSAIDQPRESYTKSTRETKSTRGLPATQRIPKTQLIMDRPLCNEHRFISVEPVSGFRGEIVAVRKLCTVCGFVQKERV
jgi:transcription elongation factor Elf1